MTNTRVITELHLTISIDALYSKSVTSYLNAWRISFNYPTIQEYYFLTLRDNNYKFLQPSYSKSSGWLTYFGQSVILCARAIIATLNHASIGKYYLYFLPIKYI